MKKKILFLSPLPPPFYGSAMSSLTCLNVLTNSKMYVVKNIKINYSKNFSDIEKLSFKKIIGYFIALFKLVYYSLIYKPDLVYIMPATSGYAFIRDFSYSLILKMLNPKIIYHLRTQITSKEKNHKLKNLVFLKAFKNSDIIVLGKEMEENINSFLNTTNTHILPNTISTSIDDEEFIAIEKARIHESKLRLIFLSNMMKSKGWPKALMAANILQQQNVDFTLNFAGSWPSKDEEDEFFSLVKEYNLQGKVNYLGHINKKQKKEVLSDSDAMIFPTEYPYEALPRVIIEAYEYGIPVISTKNGSIPSMIIQEQTGYLLADNTPMEMADYLNKLSDKNRLRQMGRSARQRFLSHYEMSVFSNNLHKIIDRCIV